MSMRESLEGPIVQFVDELEKAEARLPFVDLAVFRDQILPQSGFSWASDSVKVRSLLKDAAAQGLILTSKMHNPEDPLQPTTSIRLNRSNTRFRSNGHTGRSRFKPIRIRGGPISDTVIEDRNDRI